MLRTGETGETEEGVDFPTTAPSNAPSSPSTPFHLAPQPVVRMVNSQDYLVQSYAHPFFSALINAIEANRPQTALEVLASIDTSVPSLGHALVLATESGMEMLVLALAEKIGATNRLPTAIFILQQPVSTRNAWRGQSEEKAYKILIEQLAGRQEITLDPKSKKDLQDAVENMIRHGENQHIETLLGNAKIVSWLDLDPLLEIAVHVEVRNAQAAKVLVDKGATNTIKILSTVQRYEGSVRTNWRQKNGYEDFRKHLIAALASRITDLREYEAKEDLQSAVENMIQRRENAYLETLLRSAKIVSWLDLDPLLLSSIALQVKNSEVARWLVEKGAKNIIPALLQIQSYKGLSHYGWMESNGCEEVRRCLIEKLSKINSFEAQVRESLETVFTNIIENNYPAGSEELRLLVMNNTNFSTILDFSALLMRALESWNGYVAQAFAIVGAGNVIDAVVWMQNQYSSVGNVFQGYIQTWTTSGWQDTYRCFAYVLARDWSTLFQGDETNGPTYKMVTEKQIQLKQGEEEIFVRALKKMVEYCQEEALIILQGGEGSVIKKIDPKKLKELFFYSLEVRNAAAAELILVQHGLDDLYEALESLITKFQGGIWKKGNYAALRDSIIKSFLGSDKCSQTIGNEKNISRLFKLLELAVNRGEEVLLQQFSENTQLKQLAAIPMKINFFRFKKALAAGNGEEAQRLVANQAGELCAHLEYLMSNRLTISWIRGNYLGVRDCVMAALFLADRIFPELSEKAKFLSVLGTAIQTGEIDVLSRGMSIDDLRSTLTIGERLALFDKAVKLGHVAMVKSLLDFENENFAAFLVRLVPSYKNKTWRENGYIGVRDKLVSSLFSSNELSNVETLLLVLKTIAGEKDQDLLRNFLSNQTVHAQLKAAARWKLVKIALAEGNVEVAKEIIKNLPEDIEKKVSGDSTNDGESRAGSKLLEFNDDDTLCDFLRRLISLGEEGKVFQYLSAPTFSNRFTETIRVELFEVAVLFDQYDLANRLIEDQPIGIALRALVEMRVDFRVGKNDEESTEDALKRREVYLDLARKTLFQASLFENFPISQVEDAASSDREDDTPTPPKVPIEKRLLTQVLESFVADHEPDANSLFEIRHITKIINDSALLPHFLRYAVMVLNVPVVRVLILDDPLESPIRENEDSDTVSVEIKLSIAWENQSIALGDVIHSIRYTWERLSGFENIGFSKQSKSEADKLAESNANEIYTILIRKLKYCSTNDPAFNNYFNPEKQDKDFDLRNHSRNLIIEILYKKMHAGDMLNSEALIRAAIFLKPDEINQLLDIVFQSKYYCLLPVILERVPDRLIEIVQQVQALPLSERSVVQTEYFSLLKMLARVKISNDIGESSIEDLRKLLSFCIEQDEEGKLLKMFDDSILITALSESAATLLEQMKTQRKTKLIVLTVKHLPESSISQAKKEILSPLFLEASKKNEESLVDFFLEHINDKDCLGLFEDDLKSPLVVGVMDNAFAVVRKLLSLSVENPDEKDALHDDSLVRRQDYHVAWKKAQEKPTLPTTETIGTVFNWGEPVFPEDLRSRLQGYAEKYDHSQRFAFSSIE
jgi:hypothetical protein